MIIIHTQEPEVTWPKALDPNQRSNLVLYSYNNVKCGVCNFLPQTEGVAKAT